MKYSISLQIHMCVLNEFYLHVGTSVSCNLFFCFVGNAIKMCQNQLLLNQGI